MKMSKILMSGAVLALASSAAYAATDGGLGSTSAGTSLVQLEVLEQVQITSMADLLLDNGSGGLANTYEPGAGDVSASDDFCVYYNNATGVDLTIDSTNGAGAGYVLNAGGADNITYAVAIDENGGIDSLVAHTEGATVQYTGMASQTLNCGGTPQTGIQATVTDTGSPLGVANGTYTDTLTLTIAPNP